MAALGAVWNLLSVRAVVGQTGKKKKKKKIKKNQKKKERDKNTYGGGPRFLLAPIRWPRQCGFGWGGRDCQPLASGRGKSRHPGLMPPAQSKTQKFHLWVKWTSHQTPSKPRSHRDGWEPRKVAPSTSRAIEIRLAMPAVGAWLSVWLFAFPSSWCLPVSLSVSLFFRRLYEPRSLNCWRSPSSRSGNPMEPPPSFQIPLWANPFGTE